MSEFYPFRSQEESNIELFKTKYNALKVELYQLCDGLILFDHDCPFSTSEVSRYLIIENIMELCRICHDYFLCHNISILSSAQHILDKIVLTDDSTKDELHMYFTAYLFMNIESEPHKYQDLFDLIMDVSNFYATYLNGQEKMVFEVISLEESISNMEF
jgi:hypothetical protein